MPYTWASKPQHDLSMRRSVLYSTAGHVGALVVVALLGFLAPRVPPRQILTPLPPELVVQQVPPPEPEPEEQPPEPEPEPEPEKPEEVASDDIVFLPPSPTPTPVVKVAEAPKSTPTPTVTPRPTATPTPAPSATATPEPTSTPTPAPTSTPAPTNTPEPRPTDTPKPTETQRPTSTPQPSPTPTPVSLVKKPPEDIKEVKEPAPTPTSQPPKPEPEAPRIASSEMPRPPQLPSRPDAPDRPMTNIEVSEDVTLPASYYTDARNRLLRNFRPALNLTARLSEPVVSVIRFRIRRDGAIVHAEVVKSSGHPARDQVALDAVQKSRMLLPVTSYTDREYLTFTVPFLFEPPRGYR